MPRAALWFHPPPCDHTIHLTLSRLFILYTGATDSQGPLAEEAPVSVFVQYCHLKHCVNQRLQKPVPPGSSNQRSRWTATGYNFKMDRVPLRYHFKSLSVWAGPRPPMKLSFYYVTDESVNGLVTLFSIVSKQCQWP